MTMIASILLATVVAFVTLGVVLPRLYLLTKVRKHVQFHSPINSGRGQIVLSLPSVTLKGNVFTRTVPLADGASSEIAFDWFDDHADPMWSHTIFNRSGQFYVEQWTEICGRTARGNESVYIGRSLLTCRKLRKGEVRKLEAGDMIVQLRRHLHADNNDHHVELIKPAVAAIAAVPLAA